MSKLSISTLITLCVTSVLILGMVFGLIALDRDVSQFTQFIGLIIATGIPSIVNLVKTDRIGANVSQVQKQTNGTTSHLVSMVEALGGTLPEKYSGVERIAIRPQLAGAEPAPIEGMPNLPEPVIYESSDGATGPVA